MATATLDRDAWARIPRLGLIGTVSRVSAVPDVASSLGCASIWIKRDDEQPALGGGTKARKLDFLLASERFLTASSWHSAGAIGSGHLVALAHAAAELDRRLVAHCFPQPFTPYAARNASVLCASKSEIRPYRSRATLALLNPRLVAGTTFEGMPVVPPGATSPHGMLGLVAAAFELAEQLRAGALPSPDWIYVALGSGGTVAGLSVGLALAGIPARLCAVAAVEPSLASRWRIECLQRALTRLLGAAGVIDSCPEPVSIRIDRLELGRGYADPTPSSSRACELFAVSEILLEPAYTGKVAAALLRRAPEHRGQNVLVWNTARAPEASSTPELPAAIQRLLPTREEFHRRTLRRRSFVAAAVALSTGVAVRQRFGAYEAEPGASAKILSPREMAILMAAATAVIPLRADERASRLSVARNADRYAATLPPGLRRELALAITAFEQTPWLDAKLDRFTRLSVADRTSHLSRLNDLGSVPARIGRAVRDLCLLGYYQSPEHFAEIGYEGPPSSREDAPPEGTDELSAVRGALPRCAVP